MKPSPILDAGRRRRVDHDPRERAGDQLVLAVAPIGHLDRLQAEVSKLPQYEPKTTHVFHGGIYCREVWRDAGVLVIGKVHRCAHLYEIVSGTVRITQDGEQPREITGPALLRSGPGTKRAVLSLTPVLCRTYHATSATTPEDAEAELVEDDPASLFDAGNCVKPGVIKHESIKVLP